MKKLFIIIVSIAMCAWLASDLWARGGRGGGGGGWARWRWRGAGRRWRGLVARRLVAVRDLVEEHDLEEERGLVVAVADLATMLRVPRRCRGHRLRTFEDRVAAKLQTIGPRWATCPRRAVARVQGPEIGPAEATLVIGPARVLGRARVRDRSPDHDQEPAHDRRHAICKTFLICRVLVVGISAAAGHQAALAMGQPASVAHWPAARLQSF